MDLIFVHITINREILVIRGSNIASKDFRSQQHQGDIACILAVQ